MKEKVGEYAGRLRNVKVVCEGVEMLSEAFRMLAAGKASTRQANGYIIPSASKKRKVPLATYDQELKRAASRWKVTTLP